MTENSLSEFEKLREVVQRLRAEDGCPWDREQTHESLKPECIEEAAEVICGINILKETGNAENLQEELGDLLLQVLLHAQIAKEEGLFTIDDVCRGVSEKMIRRHPHVFGGQKEENADAVPALWEAIKQQEKAGKEETLKYLPDAFDEAEKLIERARIRKGFGKPAVTIPEEAGK